MDYFAKRIIPCLDVNEGRVVKGINFVGLRDAGDPVEVAKRYNEEGADEITFLDIGASERVKSEKNKAESNDGNAQDNKNAETGSRDQQATQPETEENKV